MKECKNKIFFFSGIAAIIIIWAVISAFDKSGFFLPSPKDVLVELVKKVFTKVFWIHAGNTFLRVVLGFLLSCVPAFVCGIWWGLKPGAHSFFVPALTVIKSTPVVSVVLLFIFWFGTDLVPIVTCAIMTFPQVSSAVYSSVKNYPSDYLMMSKAFRLSGSAKIKYMYVPHAKNAFLSSAGTALSQSWKIVCAAEVLSLPHFGLGSTLFSAKTTLEISAMFADTIAIIVLCGLCDWFFSLIAKKFSNAKI